MKRKAWKGVLEFVDGVWVRQHQNGYGCLAYKTSWQGHHWVEQFVESPEDLDLISVINDGKDIYFTPNLFREGRRTRDGMYPSRWLYADLDEVNPHTLDIRPTIAWETSEGRYQAMWLLTKAVSPKVHRALNQRLTRMIGADANGWSSNKVLRIPGTFNCKREEPFKVELLWWDDSEYSPKELWQEVKDVAVYAEAQDVPKDLPTGNRKYILKKYRKQMPKWVLSRLRDRTVQRGKRSQVLWKMYCAMLEAGIPPDAVYLILLPTKWNKFQRRPQQLWHEIHKAVAAVGRPDDQRPKQRKKRKRISVTDNDDLPIEAFGRFLEKKVQMPKWLAESMWHLSAHGLIAGEAKTYKSLLAMDLGVSVASGSEFLGRFDVKEQGPVIVVQEENTEAFMQDRLRKIAYSKGVMGGEARLNGNTLQMDPINDLPLYLINNYGFDLTDVDHLQKLERYVKKIRPKLVILDPWYLMARGVDENSAEQVTPILDNLLRIKQEYGTGLLIIHHYNKQNPQFPREGAIRISGTSVFHRWFESAIYIEQSEEPQTIRMVPDHRNAPPQTAVEVSVDMGDWGDLEYGVSADVVKNESTAAKLLALVRDHEGISLKGASHELDLNVRTIERHAREAGLEIRPGKSKGGRPPNCLFLPGV